MKRLNKNCDSDNSDNKMRKNKRKWQNILYKKVSFRLFVTRNRKRVIEKCGLIRYRSV